ncbi:Gldg family protein [Chitinophaga sancti]|uniref:ABC-2 type transport system permease protein n=1 Tax=Chitinophaga sancti TaxID=1004 RepID=A0A1K1MQJ1_9BACT|nr:Gldg family protein [Chitinophaga sancti]WQD62904.1 Gldg family protein [Chitinophaga sancti]WQG91472.1 Gldg family protein [Chitinophaga sancti]SFW25452.1 ABC-2 type transport system permease protein [Chitinophaga sancti]
MKTTFRIAKLELSNLFYSPVAWVVLIIFLVQGGWEFSSMLERMQRAQDMGGLTPGVTNTMFASFFGIFTKMKEYLYLYIPLLTMGLISREMGSGSIKLVYSSPVKVSAVVWGKYLAMVFYSFLLMLCLGVLLFVTAFIVKDADIWLVFAGILGLFLQVCAYAAIGLFMSSLTTYQVVAAITTLALLAGLNYVGKLWQELDFVRDLTYFLSISGRVDEFIDGLVSSKDVFYFLIVICMFVGLTILKLRSDRESKPWFVKYGRYAGLILCGLLLGYVSSRPAWVLYKDMTASKSRTLTPASREIVSKLKGPLEITTYVNLLDENYFSALPISRNNDLKRYDQYFRFKPDIAIKYVYYYDTSSNVELFTRNKGLSAKQVAKKLAETMKLDFKDFLSPAEIKKQVDLSGEQNRLVRQLKWGNKTTFLRTYNDLMRQPGEQEFAAALKRLAVDVPKAVFISGHNERSIKRMGDADIKLPASEITFRYSLVNQGFDVTEASMTAIPSDAAVVIIADPRTPYSATELVALKTYIDKGGNVLIAGEPSRKEIVQPVLDLIGVRLDNGMVLQQSEDFAPGLFIGKVHTGDVMKESPRLSAGVVFPGTATVSWQADNGFTAMPLVETNIENTIRRVAPVDDSLRTVVYNEALKDEKGVYPVAVAFTKGKQRILVAGDVDFMSNSELLRSNIQTGNFTFLMNLFNWFSNKEFPVDVYRAPPGDDQVKVSAAGVNVIKWMLLGVLPGLIAVIVAAVLVRRQRR